MSEKDGKTADDPVGYGKPPKSGQFKPGQSGNPSGKKKGKSLAQFIAEVGEADKTFTQGNKTVTMPANEALALKVYAEALKGKHQAAKLVLDAQRSVTGDAPVGDGILLRAEEFEVAATHADWLKVIEDARGGRTDDDVAE